MSRSLAHVLTASCIALTMLAAGCGSDGTGDLADVAEVEAGQPIPVEPDGGIGDGAEPLPGAEEESTAGEEPAPEATWHGAEVADTNCPGIEFKRVQASRFSFSVPVDFAENDVEGLDSEIGAWTGGNKVEVSFDYGPYSGDFSNQPGAEVEPIDYSGIAGKQIIVSDKPGKFVGVFFPEVAFEYDEWNLLSFDVRFTAAEDEVIARCIIGSIDWNQ